MYWSIEPRMVTAKRAPLSPPLRGELERGVAKDSMLGVYPLPSPPPQGGRERAGDIVVR
jgi:hypothetical protein